MISALLYGFLALQCLISIGENDKEMVVTIKDIPFYVSSKPISFSKLREDELLLLKGDSSFVPADFRKGFEYWIKAEFCIENDEDGYILEFFDQTIDSLTVFIQKDTAGFEEIQLGDGYYFEQKPIQHKNFQVPLDGVGHYVLYARIISQNYVDIRFAVRAIDHFIQYAISEYYLYGIFYGMILIISLYNISIFGAIREVKYVYYTFYVLSVGLFAMSVDGIAYQYLWPHFPNWNQMAHGVMLFFVIFWAILFSKKFLLLKYQAPKINLILNVILILRTLIFLYALIFNKYLFEFRNIEIIPLLVIFVGSIVALLRGYQPARFFVVAYGFLFLGFLIKSLLMLSVITFDLVQSPLMQISSYYSLHICFVFEMLFLSLALSDRVRILKEKKDRAMKRIIDQHKENLQLKEKVTQELEDLVAERTRELGDKNDLLLRTNEKLNKQTDEINAMNSKLDLDNWKLRNNIKDILQDRLINKNLSYEKFKDLFPNELTCLIFLEKMKWAKGYVCVKCKNKKFANGRVKFSRRCTKCGYDESVTSNTVFHRIKFPLEKAFYILYVVKNQEHEYTMDQLSDLLDLRRNTVWSFKRKVEKISNEDHHQVQNKTIHNIFK